MQIYIVVVYFSRQTRYRGTPRNVYRHIIVSEIKEATAALPPVCIAVARYYLPNDSIEKDIRSDVCVSFVRGQIFR